MKQNNKDKLSYRDAGVDIDAGNKLVSRIRSCAKDTMRPGVMGNLGGFGALFDLSVLTYRQPVLVSATDGVGTKIKLAIEANRHDSIGIDLVAMCVNDLIVQGAEPLFFLDYFASSRLDVDIAESVINGISRGCKLSGCSLIGGETAEMPGMYAEGDYDLAGFCVGIVEKDKIIDGSTVAPGDVLIALASSGCHSNGYSLIRKILAESDTNNDIYLDGRPIIDYLLEPTRIYVPTILNLLKHIQIKSLSHITGGGILENVPRTIPETTTASINLGSWDMPEIFTWLMTTGKVEPREMLKTFNCGVGMALCIAKRDVKETLHLLGEMGEIAWEIGKIIKRAENQEAVILNS